MPTLRVVGRLSLSRNNVAVKRIEYIVDYTTTIKIERRHKMVTWKRYFTALGIEAVLGAVGIIAIIMVFGSEQCVMPYCAF